MDANEILLDADEAATQLRMLRTRLTRLAKAGKVPSILLPDGEVRFRRADLVEWVSQYRRPTDSEVSK